MKTVLVVMALSLSVFGQGVYSGTMNSTGAAVYSLGSTINAASCSQSAVTAAIASAFAGDTVVIPSGSCTYTTAVGNTPTVSINKAITVQGQTTCTGRASTLACTDLTIIYDGTGTGSDEIPFSMTADGARLTGITFRDTRSVVDYKSPVEAHGTGWRIDHIHMTQANTSGTASHGIYAYGFGLIDHCYFADLNGATDVDGGDSRDGSYPGDYNWTQPLNAGSANAVYMEDNEYAFTSSPLDGASDAYAGARYVFRYNDVKNTNLGGHGLDSGGSRSVLLQEVYGNTISNSASGIYTWFETRGGTHFVFNNTISNAGGSYNDFAWLINYRSSCDSSACGSWGNCDGTSAGGSGIAGDQNSVGQQGYACRDGIGRGPETNAAADWPQIATGYSFSEQLSPGYSWNNNWKGGAPTVSNVHVCGYNDCTRATTYHVVNNRDFVMEVPSFNGTAGTGTGLLSARPATCTPNVAYFATDQGAQGTLYQCSATNTWTAFYAPYAYPHPLQNTGAGTIATYAQLPQLWVHNFIQPDTQADPICNPPGGAYTEADVTLSTLTVAGLQTAINSWAGGYRRIKIPAGTLLNSSTYTNFTAIGPSGITYKQNSLLVASSASGATVSVVANPTGCLVIESATPPTRYQTVCSHGLPGYGGTRNPGCTADIANLWTIRQDESPGGVSNSAIYVPAGASKIVIRDFEATVLPGTAQSSSGPTHGRNQVVIDGETSGIGVEYAYIHGWDPGDAGQPGAGSGNAAVDAVTGACVNWNLSGTVNTSGTAVTWVSGNRFGMTFSDGVNLYGQTYVHPQAIITINGVAYTIASGGHDPAASDTTLTLATSAGTQTGVAYTLQNPLARYATGCGDDISNAITWAADNSWIMWSYIEKMHYWQTEGHSVLFGFQNGPVKLAHNWIESGSGGVFTGGGPVDGRRGPVKNVEMRANIFLHDLNWKYLTGGQGHSPAPPWGAGPLDQVTNHDNAQWQWAIKNALEFKFLFNAVLAGNIIEGSWNDGQNGEIFGFDPRVCSGGAICGIFDSNGLPRQGFKDIRLESNWFRNGSQGADFSGRSDGPGNGGGVSSPTENIDWINNVWTGFDINEFGAQSQNANLLLAGASQSQTYLCTMTRASGIAHAACQAGSVSGPNANVSISSVIRAGGVTTVNYVQRHDPMLPGTVTIANVAGWNGTFTLAKDTTCSGGTCSGAGTSNGILPSGSQALCDNDATPWVTATNAPCIQKNGRFGTTLIYADSNTPADATLCTSTATCSSAIGTNNLSHQTLGYSITDISVGDPILIFSGYSLANQTGCTGSDATYYTSNTTSYRTGLSGLPDAIAPTNPAGLDVYYANAGTDDASGTIQCYISTIAGFPKNVTFANNSIVNSSQISYQVNQFYYQPQNFSFTKNLYAAPDLSTGGCGGKSSFLTSSTICEGSTTALSGAAFDPTTFSLQGNVLQGRNSTYWPAVPGTGTANLFPANASCSGSTPDATCVGMAGFMNGTAFPSGPCANANAPFNCPLMTLPWANNLTLSQLAVLPSSLYSGAGADVTAMAAAFTSTIYQVPTGLSAGSTGPFRDAP